MQIKQKTIGGALLISGTCVGAGMLALPISMAPLGFHLSWMLLVSVWLLMCYSALLVLEVNTWLPEHTTYISMARYTLGRWGELCTWLMFICLLYAVLVAYVTAGGALLAAFLHQILHIHFAVRAGEWIWVGFFAAAIYVGVWLVDVLNRIFVIGLIAVFSYLAAVMTPHLQWHLLQHVDCRFLLLTLPIVFVSFGFHVIIPSIRTYLNGCVKSVQCAIVGGSILPLCVYAFWVFLVFSTIPTAQLSAVAKAAQPVNALVNEMSALTQQAWVYTSVRFFVFFAIASSFIGTSLALFDLLADGLKRRKTGIHRLQLLGLVYLPVLMFALIFPSAFIVALGYAGLFVILSHGILPIAMVWSGRYHMRLASDQYRVIGGRLLLMIACLLFCVVMLAQLPFLA